MHICQWVPEMQRPELEADYFEDLYIYSPVSRLTVARNDVTACRHVTLLAS
jgi:hypothetical protein